MSDPENTHDMPMPVYAASASAPAPEAQLSPISTSGGNFLTQRKNGELFVDKTARLVDLVKMRHVFLSRPRRFGKSLLISMLQELFQNGTKNFQGLAIQKLDLWHRPPCKVLAIDCFNLSDPSTLESELCDILRDAFFDAGFDSADSVAESTTDLNVVARRLNRFIKKDDPVVVLIDEWDFPLSANLHDRDAFDANKRVLGKLYAWVRSLVQKKTVEFTLVTGIGRYRDTSLFTGQHITDISMMPLFADILGYTQQELETFFAPYINLVTERYGLSKEELLHQIKLHYDGFCFDFDASCSLYNPVAINSFFKYLDYSGKSLLLFPSYWVNNGNTPSILRTFLNRQDLDGSFLDSLSTNGVKLDYNEFSSPTTFEKVELAPVLVQTGYMSIKENLQPELTDPFMRSFRCSFTNTEVETKISSVLMSFITHRTDESLDGALVECAQQAAQALDQLNLAAFVDQLNYFLGHVHYDVWAKADERRYRGLISLFLRFAIPSYQVREEVPNNVGRADIELTQGDKLWVFELKLARGSSKGIVEPTDDAQVDSTGTPTDSASAAAATSDADGGDGKSGRKLSSAQLLRLGQEARAQIVDKGYGTSNNAATVKKRYGVALVISEERRQVLYWSGFTKDQELGSAFSAPLSGD